MYLHQFQHWIVDRLNKRTNDPTCLGASYSFLCSAGERKIRGTALKQQFYKNNNNNNNERVQKDSI